MTNLTSKTVLVTGATGGFGQHMSSQFAAKGCSLILTDLDDARLAALAKIIDAGGMRTLAVVAADLSTADGCSLLLRRCDDAQLVPDILVNNAGIGMSGRHDHVPADRWQELMQLNLLAPMRLCAHFLPQMIERGSGHIVNISSLAGWVGAQSLSAYCASKFGLRGFGEALAADTEGLGVQVSNVYPSFCRTPILDSRQFGVEQKRVVPEHLIFEPGDVVARIIRGIERDKLHIFPDRISRQVHYIKRFCPWLIPIMNRRLTAAGSP